MSAPSNPQDPSNEIKQRMSGQLGNIAKLLGLIATCQVFQLVTKFIDAL